jgi:hypothetical protein
MELRMGMLVNRSLQSSGEMYMRAKPLFCLSESSPSKLHVTQPTLPVIWRKSTSGGCEVRHLLVVLLFH